MTPKLHSIGRVAGKHGFSGELSLALNSGFDHHTILKGSFIFVEFDGKGVPFLIEHFKSQTGIIKLSDINSTEDAANLEGRNVLYALEEEPEDALLSGFEGFLLMNNGSIIGKIEDVVEYPAGFMLRIKSEENEILIPWVEDWLVNIDPEKGIIEMDLPDGLVDLYNEN